MKTAFIYGLLLSLSFIACKKDVDTPNLSPGCVDSSLYGTNPDVFGKWTLVATRNNVGTIAGQAPGNFTEQCGLDIRIANRLITVTDRINNESYSSVITVQDQSIIVEDQDGFYPEFRQSVAGIGYQTVSETELLLTVTQGREGEGTTYRFRALK